MDAEPEAAEQHREEVEDGMRLDSDTHARRLLNGTGSLWQEGALCDVSLEAEGVQFAAHKVILASVSSYCRLLFIGSPSLFLSGGLVRLQGVSARGLERVLGLVYRGYMNLSLDVVEETLQAAKTLLIRDAIKLCLHFLDISLTPKNCPRILGVAHRLGPSQFHNRVLEYLGAHCKGLLRYPETLLDLDPKALLQLLGQDDLGDISETDLLHGALRWLQHHPDHAAHAQAVLYKLRLPLVPPEALLDELGHRPLVCADPRCLQLLQKALAYHARPHLQPALQGPSTSVRGAAPCLVVLGGRTTGNQVSREVWATEEGDVDWRRLGELEAPLYNHCCVVLNNFLFVLGGQHLFDPCGKQPTNEVHRYDPRTETWLQVPGMLEKRTRFHADVLSGGLVAVAGGTLEGKLTASTERYSLGEDRWEPAAPLPVAVVDHAGATHKGILYISGGFSGGNTLSDLYSYLPRLKRWVLNRPSAFSRCDHGMATLGDTIYCVGGRTLSKENEWVHVTEMEFYCPAVDQWTTVTVSPLGCTQFSLTVSSPQLYMSGGGSLHNKSKTTGVFTYARGGRKWERAGTLPVALADHCACILSISAQTLRRIKSQNPPHQGDGLGAVVP